MKQTLTWLHLSDLHARSCGDWDSREVTGKLVNDLKTLQKERGLRPDLVFFTGDAAFGSSTEEQMVHQYQLVRAFLDQVRGAFDPEIPLRDVYLVPGNHDVDRGEVSPGETDWLRMPDRGLEEILAAMDKRSKQWRAWIERLGSYRSFLTSYGLLHLSPGDPHLIWADTREFGGRRIGIGGLNSAWSCVDHNDKGKLWIGADWQIAQLKKTIGPVDFSIALIHHPGNWLTASEDPSAFRKLRQEFPLILHGHEHQEWVEIDGDDRVVLSSGACYQSSWMENGFSIGQIDLEKRCGRVFLRQWDSTGSGWVARDIAGKTKDGIWPLKRLSWLGETPENVQSFSTTPAAPVEAHGGEASEHYTRRFCQHVVDQHDFLDLFGCDIPRELQRHQLSVAYVSLNLSQESGDEVTDANRVKPQTKLKTAGYEVDGAVIPDEDDEAISAGIDQVLDDVSEGTGRLIIRGPAGAGKSTLLRWCAIHAAQQVLGGPSILAKAGRIASDGQALQEWNQFKDENPHGTSTLWRFKIPVLIRLRDCPDGRLPAANDLPSMLAKHLPSAPVNWMTDVLESGRALILLDGVDEIHREKRARLAEEIGELIRTYQHCTYVVTTRPGAVEMGWLDRLQFSEARVEPMSRGDREEFIDKWYRSAALELKHRPRLGEDLGATASRLKGELLDQPELGVLASNPLLCAMICALYRERQERLPETPAELCEALIQMLLHRRERETPGLLDAHFPTAWRGLQYPQKKSLLADLAWQMVQREESAIDLDSAKRIVEEALKNTPGRTVDEAPEVLQALVERSGLLRPAADHCIDFLHNTLKEYLTGGRVVEGGKWEFLVERADDPAWQPIILFALALAPEPFSSGLVRRLLERVPAFARGGRIARNPNLPSKTERTALLKAKARQFFLVRCRSTAKRLAPDLSSSIDGLTARLFPPAYMPEVEALAQLGPRIIVHNAASLKAPKWWSIQDCKVIVRCLRLLRLVGGPAAAAALTSINRLPDHSSQVTVEWMMASSELCNATLPWPFLVQDRVWAKNTRLSDLRPVSSLGSLTYLNLAWTRVDDLSPIAGLKRLKDLVLIATPVSDLAPLSNLPSLEVLSLTYSRVRHLHPLEMIASLKHLVVGGQLLNAGELERFRQCRPDVLISGAGL